MKRLVHEAAGFSVIKVGGGLSRLPGALERVCAALNELSQKYPLLVVPGGGPFADAVRAFGRGVELSADAAHWMAVLAMDQYAHVLADRMPGAELIEEPGEIPEILSRVHLAVLAPSRWMRSADVFPHSWEVTSDSVAAYVAGALGAERLVLVKPADCDTPVDGYFARALPAELPYLIIPWDRVNQLANWFSGPTAAGAPLG